MQTLSLSRLFATSLGVVLGYAATTGGFGASPQAQGGAGDFRLAVASPVYVTAAAYSLQVAPMNPLLAQAGTDVPKTNGDLPQATGVPRSRSATTTIRGGPAGLPALQRPTLQVQLGHFAYIASVAFSPDGRHALTGGRDGTACLWDVTSGKEIRAFPGRGPSVHSPGQLASPAEFSPDGKQVFAGDRLWDSASGKEIRNFNAWYPHGVRYLSYSPDRKRVLLSNYATVQLWDLSTEKKVFELPEASVVSMAFSPDGSQILTGQWMGAARTWDAASGRQIQTFKTAEAPEGPEGAILQGRPGGLRSVVFSPDAKQILTAEDGMARLWDVASGNTIHTFRENQIRRRSATLGRVVASAATVSHAIFSPDGKQILTAGAAVRLWNAASGNEVRTWEIIGYVLAFSPDGKQVLIGNGYVAPLFDVASGRELRRFQGHSGPVLSVAFSPGGNQVLTAGTKTAGLWDIVNCTRLRDFPTNPSAPPILFSPDGTQILSATKDVIAQLWNVASGKRIRNFRAREANTAPNRVPPKITTLAFSRDGTQILAGTQDGTARLWDLASARQIRMFRHGYSSIDVAFGLTADAAPSPQGERVYTGGTSWDPASGKQIRTFGDELLLRVNALRMAFSPDGREILTASDDGVARLWDAASGKELRTFPGHTVPTRPSTFSPAREHTARVSAVAFSLDGKQVLTASEDANWLWDKTTGQEIRAFKSRELTTFATRSRGNVLFPQTSSIVFSPDGKQVLTANSLGTVCVWNAATGDELRSFHAPYGGVQCMALSRDAGHVLTAGGDGIVRVWDVTNGKELRHFQYSRDGLAAVFSSDGTQLFTGGSFWDVATGKIVGVLQGQRSLVYSVAVSRDGKWALTGSDGFEIDKSAKLWDAATGKQLHTLQHRGGVYSVAFSPDGKQLLTGCDDGVARLWDAASGKLLLSFNWYTTAPNAQPLGNFKGVNWVKAPHVAISPDGKQVLTATNGGRPRLWDAASGKEIREFDMTRGSNSSLSSLVFSHDGKHVLTAGGSRFETAELWDPANGRKIRAFVGHSHQVTSAVFSPDSRQILTGSIDGTARLWDAASGRELCRLVNFLDGSWVAATPDQYYMASKAALPGVAFSKGDRSFPFEQFDLKFNRPDRVLESIGLASREVISAYRQAYVKRLQRMHFTEDMLGDDFHIPEIAVSCGTSLTSRERTLKLNVKAKDSEYLLDRFYVDVNGVPIYGSRGIALREHRSKTWEQEIEVELCAGKNTIDVSVLNEKGAESLKERMFVDCEVPPVRPNLYVLAVGVSDYQDSRFRLTYADKDARDVADLFESKRSRFGEIKVLRILDRDATRENILQARHLLTASHVDDVVVVFFAGHGLLDSKLDYYFATADIDFNNPANRGLPYEAIEELLDGIRARKKLLLMDTCHSGELDKEEIQAGQSEKQPEGEVKVATRSGLERKLSPRVGLVNSYQLLRERFVDLRRGTGAVVIAAAGGTEYSVESAAWKNGVFTYALLRGLRGEANQGRDAHVRVSKLRDFVEQEVRRLTADRQSPTVRRENLEFDFAVD